MSKNNQIINSFVSGEVSDKFIGRSDTQQYNQSCEELLNSLVYPQGGSGRRPGTRVIREIQRASGAALSGTDGVRIIPFYASDGTRWNLALTGFSPDEPVNPYTNQSLEWKAHSSVTDNGSNVTNIGLATLAGTAAIYSSYYTLDVRSIQYAQAGDTLIIVTGSKRPLRIVYNPNGGSRLFTIRPYPDVGEWSNAALTTVTIPAVSDQTWKQSAFLTPVVQSAGNKLSLNLAKGTDTLYTITPGSGSTITFGQGWVGKLFKFSRQTQAVVILITSRTSSTVLRGIPIGGTNITNSTNYDYGGATADQFYEESAWSDERGWPSAVCFFETRLVFGGQRAQVFGAIASPDEIWFTAVNNILKFDYRGLVSDAGYGGAFVTSDPFSVTLRSNVLNTIKWLSPKKTILSGTDFEEFVVQGPSPTKTIGIDNIQTYGETATGSAPVQPVRVEAGTIFIDRTRRILRELAYNFNEDALSATNLNILASHMGYKSQLVGLTPIIDTTSLGYVQEGFIEALARQALPLGIVWALDSYGCLLGLTREREQNVTAWHYHQIAGTVNASRPLVRSVSVIQTGPTKYGVTSSGLRSAEPDELWMAVERTVGYDSGGGVIAYANRTFLERMEKDWDQAAYSTNWMTLGSNSDAIVGLYGGAPIYMDGCSIHRSGADETTALSGIIKFANLPQGAGASVDVIVNGLYLGKRTIGVGGLNLYADLLSMGLIGQFWIAQVGFSYTNRIVPVTPEAPATTGSSLGLPRRVSEMTIKFARTVAAKFGRRSDQDEEVTPVDPLDEVYFKPGPNQNDPIPLFTGDKRVQFPQGYESAPKIVIESSLPFPMFVNSIVAKMVAYE